MAYLPVFKEVRKKKEFPAQVLMCCWQIERSWLCQIIILLLKSFATTAKFKSVTYLLACRFLLLFYFYS